VTPRSAQPRATRGAASRRECRSFLADVLAGALAHLREAARAVLSAALAAACLLSLAWPLLLGTVRLLAASVTGWAWDLLARVAWDSLAAQLPSGPSPLLAVLEANTTLPAALPALLLEAAPPAGEVHAVGTAWTWACLALATWRRHRAGR
jgi:hypothetical protein